MIAKEMLCTIAGAALFAASTFASSTFASNITTPSSTGCIAPSAMKSCLDTAQNDFVTCMQGMQADGSDSEFTSCQFTVLLAEMVCYQSACWNKAYSCEYQYLASSYVFFSGTTNGIPFYPAPDNASGGCSCNLGQVFTNATNFVNDLSTCDQSTGSVSDCECCALSGALSAFYGFCPNTSSKFLGSFWNDMSAYANASGLGDICGSVTADTCATYGFYSADNGTFVNPASLPAGGTQTIHNTAGSSSLTTPPAGSTITWSVPGKMFTMSSAESAITSSMSAQTYTVTASPYNAANVGATATATTGSGTGTATATATGTEKGTATGTATAATTTTSKGAAASLSQNCGAWGAGALCVGLLLAVF